MPIPIIAYIVGGVICVIAGAVLALNWKKVEILLKGKTLAVLGEQRVGKTTLIKFLTEGVIPKGYSATGAAEKTKSNSRRVANPDDHHLKDLKLRFKQSHDVGGDWDAHKGQWKKTFDAGDLVLYLVRADNLLNGDMDTQKRVLGDAESLRLWLKEAKKSKPIAIVGTHTDLDPRFMDRKKRAEMEAEFLKLDTVRKLAAAFGGSADVAVVVGSLYHDEDTRRLVYSLFSALTR